VLRFTQYEATQGGDADELFSSLLLQQPFLTEHFGAWTGSYTEGVNAHAVAALYRELAELTERFVCTETEALRS
jgi:TorA maturation chaperone TorD